MNNAEETLITQYHRVARKLKSHYGYPEWREHLPPVDELVNTILSQNTNDTNRDMAFARLRARYPTWESVRDGKPEDIIDAIRPAGLANQKGPRIQAALRTLTESQGEITLDHLQDMPVEDAKAWLTSIDGVGPKTAAIILLFAMNKPAFPVDTHVHRVTKRLGLIGEKTGREKAHVELEKIVPTQDYYAFHLQIIQHGREICAARSPQCSRCFLQDECLYFR
nr:endonuclease III [Anaerolineae bacterium]